MLDGMSIYLVCFILPLSFLTLFALTNYNVTIILLTFAIISLSIPLYLIFPEYFVLGVSLGNRYTWILLKEKPHLKFSVFELGNLSVAIYWENGNIWFNSDNPVWFSIFM